MQIGGTLVTAVVRIAVIAATLACVYYFLLRPILDTTEKVSGGINDSIQKSLDQADQAFDQANISTHTQRTITTRIKNVPTDRLPQLNRCISRAGADLGRIERCAARLSRP
ncbi:MAG: hypothetical protein J0H98_10930 [Solirubrobacterales bacterium]|nr:hypothetical protein [Solirubrobacterales bacterium]